MSKELKPCPFCGGEIAIADMGYYLMITRVSGMKASSMCKCRIFMESDTFAEDDLEAKNEARKNLIEKWNRRPSPWHTGTPTEKGWYVCKLAGSDIYETHNFTGNNWDETLFDKWRKIEPYKEKTE